MYKSIVFDLGGVMIDFDPRGYLVDRLCNAETEEEVYDLTFGSEEWKLLDAGLISRFDGNHRMLEKARAAGRAFEVQGVLDDWLHILRPRHRMEELVRRLKSHGYCVYYLSNIPQDVLDLLRDRGVLDGFDGGVASCEVHINKPDPKIYKALLDKYSLKAEACVFLSHCESLKSSFFVAFAAASVPCKRSRIRTPFCRKFHTSSADMSSPPNNSFALLMIRSTGSALTHLSGHP